MVTLIYSTNKQFIYNDDNMANIFEFKYEFYDGYSNKPNKYIILQTNKKETSMLTYNYGKKQCINITDKVDKFCNDISKSEFLGWLNKNFQSILTFSHLPIGYQELKLILRLYIVKAEICFQMIGMNLLKF